jgi:phosphatidylglycerophosphatase A
MRIAELVSTFFYIGYFPVSPGTCASAVACGLLLLMRGHQSALWWVSAVAVAVGLIACLKAKALFKKDDPGCVVIDEVAGMCISLLGVPLEMRWVLPAFFLFRILDIFKPYPASYIESRKGSFGIMGDDIIAGLYTNLIMQFLLRVL